MLLGPSVLLHLLNNLPLLWFIGITSFMLRGISLGSSTAVLNLDSLMQKVCWTGPTGEDFSCKNGYSFV